jgi:cyclopropane fatty-acyl-phospholipid synthase-like methyltransferase
LTQEADTINQKTDWDRAGMSKAKISYQQSIREHYGRNGLKEAILTALGQNAKHVDSVTRDDLLALDEFHIRGRKATQELAERVGLHGGMKVLDIGCGIGGPARTLAAEFGCHVTGVDIIEEYCETATFLSRHLGLSDKVEFRCADISTLPCDNGDYDVVWSQHVLINVVDKSRLFREIRRVLRPRGIYAFFEICAGSVEPPHFPVPWASDQNIHFSIRSEAMRAAMQETFREEEWRDVSAESLDWYGKVLSREKTRHATRQPALGLHLLMGQATREKMDNVVRNLEEDRIRVIQGIMTTKERRTE